MSVTIGIFVHNEIPLLKRTLKSLQENTEYPYQLIIVDDGSDKQAGDYLRILCALNHITLIKNNKQRGYSHCANIVIDYSKTPYILFLDGAVYVTKNWLFLLINKLEENPSHGIAGPSTNLTRGDQCILSTPNPHWREHQIETFAKNLKKQYKHQFKYLDKLHNVSGFCYCVKREVVEKVGYFDEAFGLGQGADIDYNTRAAHAGYKGLRVCGAYVHRYSLQGFGPDTRSLLVKNKEKYQPKICRLQVEKHPKKIARYPQQFTIIKPMQGDNAVGISIVKECPLVSCIMPTSDRPLFVPKAIEYFLRQDYPNKELIILDDGVRKTEKLIPSHPNIRYFKLKHPVKVGEKRNITIEKSRGEIIMHWDDDDFYASGRIRYQVQALLNKKADLCALRPDLYYDVKTGTFWHSREELHNKLYYGGILGGSMTYKKELWKCVTKFPSSMNLAEDAAFLKQLPGCTKIIKLPNQANLIYIRHNQNTWRFTCGRDVDQTGWIKVSPPREIQGADVKFYQNLRRQLFKIT